MSDDNAAFPCFIKELCKLCYQKKKYNQLKKDKDNIKKCESIDCNNSSAIYVKSDNPTDFVRDFRNFQNFNIKKCSFDIKENEMVAHLQICQYAHNDFEYFMWQRMISKKIYNMTEIFNKYFEPFIYYPRKYNKVSNRPIPISTLIISEDTKKFIPQTILENEIIQQVEKKKLYFCCFCLKNITTESDIDKHLNGQNHRANYEADKKRRWYFKMPQEKVLKLCSCSKSQCLSPHSTDENQEMIARLKFRSFMAAFQNEIADKFELLPKKISRWPTWVNFSIPKFPSNINCYKEPVQIFPIILINLAKCEKLHIYLRDDESRPFFKLIKTNENQEIMYKNQSLTALLNPNEKINKIEFGIEFHPIYSSSYCQIVELELTVNQKTFTFAKRIRVDVGTNAHMELFENSWNKYREVILRKAENKHYVPFKMENCKSPLNEKLLSDIFKVIPNREWIDTTIENYNYCDWMKDMMVLEELEQRLILSKLEFCGQLTVVKSILINDTYYYPPNDGNYGNLLFEPKHDMSARDIIIKYVSNCYLNVNGNSALFECELVDKYRYDIETKSELGVSIFLSKATVESLKLDIGVHESVRVYFIFDRMAFEFRHISLNNIPTFDRLSYSPLACPYFTRLPYGDEELRTSFRPKTILNEEQVKLPRLILRILSPNEIALPFVLNGAFGTGKSLLCAETVITILENQPKSRVLICTRSYSAGEVYINIFKKKIPNKCQRIKFIKSSKSNFVTSDLTAYTDDLNNKFFQNNQVFVTTLNNASGSLMPFQNFLKENSVFNFVFVDEAAQVLEVDAIMVYQFGNQNCKFIFVGDVYQMKPDIYNKRLQKFAVPIIKRLYDAYRSMPEYMISLTKVYRTHPKIVEYLRRAIYTESPLTSLMKPFYINLAPMKFVNSNAFVSSSTGTYDFIYNSYINTTEVEIIIKELCSFMNKIKIDESQVLVCTPFYSQIQLIRKKLRAIRMSRISVELPSGIQGKEYDAVFISTVLTENRECNIQNFHNEANVINLVISRAKHYVEVVGDQNCLIKSHTGKQWNEFIKMSNETLNM